MKILLLIVCILFSSCSIKRNAKTTTKEHKTETIQEERKSTSEEVTHTQIVIDTNKVLVRHDETNELIETFTYTPPDSAGVQYIQEYKRTTKVKNTNAKEEVNTLAKSEKQDSLSIKSETSQTTHSETKTKTKTQESIKSKTRTFTYAIPFIISFLALLLVFRKK